MRRWLTVLFCLLALSGTQTAAQEWDGVHYRLMLDAPDACWSVAYDVPCVSLVKLASVPQYCETGGVCIPMWKLILRSRPVLVSVLVLVTLVHNDMTAAQSGLRVCTLADSSTDEYRANDQRGYTFPSVNLNWLEQLAQYRIGYYDFGNWGAWSGYRRNGYSRNVARSGASASYIQEAYSNLAGLTTELLPFVSQCDVVVYSIGSNDYAPYFASAFYPVYSGSVTPEARASAVIAAFQSSFEQVYTAKPTIKAVINLIPDVAQVPMIAAAFPDPVGRSRVSQSIGIVNTWLAAQADGVHAVAVSVYNEHGTPQFPVTFDAGYVWNIGGYSIPFWRLSDNPTQGGLLWTDAYGTNDGHAGALYSCMAWANVQIRGINQVMGLTIPEFSQTECLQHANLLENPATPTTPPPTATFTPVPTVTPFLTWTPSPVPTNTPPPTPTITGTVFIPPTLTHTPTMMPVPPTATEQPEVCAIIVVDIAGVHTEYPTCHYVIPDPAAWCSNYVDGVKVYRDYVGYRLPDGFGGYTSVRKTECFTAEN